ncbi:TetR/AcrR family transcriptional regulator [Fodinicola feengrottensis]|uniref:TetR/AcrR family transcriptional regulator n=1 Tax=Fodinicola feengrottensis TaxID=435914 RepID=UPI0013D11A6B|nr:TetR/AcrR family transcriptional regulator [Fodinicola feengrottensis]
MRTRGERDGRTFTEQARRAQLVACAIDLVAQSGYAQASVSKIAERAGVAKSAVLYYFDGKEELLHALITEIFLTAVPVMVPAVEAESTAVGKLGAYVRSNGEFIATHRNHALAMLEIWTSYRSPAGQRLDEVMAASVADRPPVGDLAALDPAPILELGQRNHEFRAFSVPAMAIAVRQAVDGAVLHLSRNPDFDVRGYCEELVTTFDLATRRQQ